MTTSRPASGGGERVEYPEETLLYRRQFVLGPAFIERLASWQRYHLRDWCLMAHPELPVTVRRGGKASMMLLGYIMDPSRPERGDEETLDDLLAAGPLQSIITRTAGLGGRWILIHDDSATLALLTDATGMRQV